MRNIVAVGGVPGTGKTTLFRKYMEDMEWVSAAPCKFVTSSYNKERDLYVLGKYEEGETFAGTDRLSMSVQPPLQEWVSSTTSNILFEGDRVFNQSFLEFCMNLPDTALHIVYLNAPKELLEQRYKDRGSNQSEVFLKGRATKYNNILSNFELMPYTTEFSNTTFEEQSIVLTFIKNTLR